MARCPEDHNRLEIDDAGTGQRLTAAGTREPQGFFHSRLAVSPSGRYLLSAGWMWHPWGCLVIFDLHAALEQPQALDIVSQSAQVPEAQASTLRRFGFGAPSRIETPRLSTGNHGPAC